MPTWKTRIQRVDVSCLRGCRSEAESTEQNSLYPLGGVGGAICKLRYWYKINYKEYLG